MSSGSGPPSSPRSVDGLTAYRHRRHTKNGSPQRARPFSSVSRGLRFRIHVRPSIGQILQSNTLNYQTVGQLDDDDAIVGRNGAVMNDHFESGKRSGGG